MIRWVLAALVALLPVMATAQELTALARVQPGGRIVDASGGVQMRLPLSQPVPFRVRHLGAPPRLVIDFREVDWTGTDTEALNQSTRIAGLRAGQLRPGWSRLVLDLAKPMVVQDTQMTPQSAGGAVFELRLNPASIAEFAARIAALSLPAPSQAVPITPLNRQDGSRPVRVMLDPGHGGIDPGAVRGDVIEADLMLTFARELRELLRRAGFEVTLTRDENIFVPLEARLTLARAARADLFLSLHADVVTEGNATGATVYTLSEAATDTAARKLAERHDRADLLSGVDLSQQDDVIAGVLMDLARQETTPRSNALAAALVTGLGHSIGRMHKHPHQTAAFSVLKAPDIPSVLIELGFMSSKQDLANLTNAEWRENAAQGIRDALLIWARDDAAQAALLRQ